MTIDPKDITGKNWYIIHHIKEYPDRITITYGEKHNKTTKRIVIRFDADDMYHFEERDVKIHCKREDLVKEINKVGFSWFESRYVTSKNGKSSKKREDQLVQRKRQLMSKLKPGDIVERVGSTPNLGLRYIKIDEMNNYGVSGFYVYLDGKRSNQYTQVSWRYIKGEVIM